MTALTETRLVELADQAWRAGDRRLAASLLAQADGAVFVAARGEATVAKDGGCYSDRIGFQGADESLRDAGYRRAGDWECVSAYDGLRLEALLEPLTATDGGGDDG